MAGIDIDIMMTDELAENKEPGVCSRANSLPDDSRKRAMRSVMFGPGRIDGSGGFTLK